MQTTEQPELPTVNLAALERLAIVQALKAQAGNRTRAAQILGLSVRSLQRKMNGMGIQDRPPSNG